MVKVELVDDDANIPAPSEEKVAIDVSSDEEFFEEEDDFDLNETFAERIVALKDVIPPNYRASIASTVSGISDFAQSSVTLGGKALWVVATSTLLLGVPLALSVIAEQELIEMEKGMQLGNSTNSVLAPGAESGFAEPNAAPRA